MHKETCAHTEELVLSHMKLCRKISFNLYLKYKNLYGDAFSIDFDDILATGYLGLVTAARRYNKEFGYKFSSYAYRCIDGEIKSFVFRSYPLIKPSGNTIVKVSSMESSIDRDIHITILDIYGNKEGEYDLVNILLTVKECLTEKEYEVFRMRYVQDMSQIEIANVIKCSRSNVAHILKKIRVKLSSYFCRNT